MCATSWHYGWFTPGIAISSHTCWQGGSQGPRLVSIKLMFSNHNKVPVAVFRDQTWVIRRLPEAPLCQERPERWLVLVKLHTPTFYYVLPLSQQSRKNTFILQKRRTVYSLKIKPLCFIFSHQSLRRKNIPVKVAPEGTVSLFRTSCKHFHYIFKFARIRGKA